MSGFLNDLRFGLRQLAAKPGFAAAVILALAFGTARITAVCGVLNSFVSKSLPYPEATDFWWAQLVLASGMRYGWV